MNDELILETMENALEVGRKVIPYGNVATYIPELSKADKNALGIAVRTKDGRLFTRGDCGTRFTLQSISKVVSLIVALERFGADRVFDRAGMEPSGEAFNSIVELDLYSGKPYNPMINSGAIAVADLLLKDCSFGELLAVTRVLMSDPEAELDEAVYRSEMANCSRNRAIGWLLKSKGIIDNDVEDVLELYTAMCSVNATAVSLANLGLLLSNGGVDLASGKRVFSSETARIVKTLMLTCGMYDGSGQFAVEVGFPTKSGVGGGLLSVVDRNMGIGIYGPSLDSKGNCVAGRTMLRFLSSTLGLHIFNS